jgi:ABC-type dipeptide/oligopeptide/nickel transport system ATPase subunit
MSRASSRAIEVLGARTHNLKGISCRIPHEQVTVVTGLSGAGKSSLVFDTVYAEAQRRYVESMSTYARQFLEQMERPPIEAMHNILPAVALEARNTIKNARSTVGTITEVHDVLRLLFTHLGVVHCPEGHGPVRRYTPQEVADRLAAGDAGAEFYPVAALPRPKKLATEKLQELVRQGYSRIWQEGQVVRLAAGARWPKALDPLRLGRRRQRALLRPRAHLQRLRPGAAPACSRPLLVQLAARCLPHLPGVRPGDRHRSQAGDPGSDPDPSRAADRTVEHPGLRGAL